MGGDKTLLIMASAHSSDLAIELITTGENAGLWGTITNTNLKRKFVDASWQTGW